MVEGVIVPIVTPFDDSLKVDFGSLENLTKHLVDAKVNGIFACGATGEFQYLSDDEKIEVVKSVINAADGKTKVYVGVTGTSENATKELIEKVNRVEGLDGIVLAPLVYHSNRKLVEHMFELSILSNYPIILYNNPALVEGPRRKSIRTRILKEISHIANVIAIKDSSESMKRLVNYIKATINNKFSVLQGDERNIAFAYELGAKGAVPEMANLFPELFIKLHLCKGDMEELLKYQQDVNLFHYFIYARGNKKIGALKYSLSNKGIIKTGLLRDEKQQLNDSEMEFIKRNYLRVNETSARIRLVSSLSTP